MYDLGVIEVASAATARDQLAASSCHEQIIEIGTGLLAGVIAASDDDIKGGGSIGVGADGLDVASCEFIEFDDGVEGVAGGFYADAFERLFASEIAEGESVHKGF